MLVPLLLAALAAPPAAASVELPSERPVGQPELVATFDGPMPTGVSVHPSGRIFVNFPRWGDDPPATLAELKDGKAVAYPSAAMQRYEGRGDSEHLISVQSVVVGPAGRVWALDTGRVQFAPAEPGGPKLVAFDPDSGEVVQKIVFPADVALPTTYLNDVRFDLTRGERGRAYITDSASHGGIIVVDLASGDSWRRLHDTAPVRPEPDFLPFVEGRPLLQRPEGGEAKPLDTGSDGIALSEDGSTLYFRVLAGRRLFSVPTDALGNREQSDEEVLKSVTDHGDLGFASDGLEHDAAGTLYLTNYEDNALVARRADGTLETILHDPRLLWPDTLSVGADGFLYVTANQLHRQAKFHRGEDLREKPYVLVRIPIEAGPVTLK
ncbi:L-dopachrome tautomerase-related protein [Alienimonas sp. DA493]|uniref:L-dopachrome tautomerase-related protein n=1 Tax=Alienimonas sp. DA493 TaxID=3373605 RepID=UPI0037548F5B